MYTNDCDTNKKKYIRGAIYELENINISNFPARTTYMNKSTGCILQLTYPNSLHEDHTR